MLRKDVRKFVSPEEQELLDLWSPQFFLGHLEGLVEYLQPKQISIADLIAKEKGKRLFDLVKEAIASAPLSMTILGMGIVLCRWP